MDQPSTRNSSAPPEARLASGLNLSELQRHQLLTERNQFSTEYPPDKSVHQLFEEQVARTPGAVAVVFENQGLTYRELNRRANQLAHLLQTRGVGPEVLVGICLERSLELIVGLLGILKAGGAYVPLDPTYPKERLHQMVADAQLGTVVTQGQWQEALGLLEDRLVCLDVAAAALTQQSTENPITGTGPENLAYVIYTSGSTGLPKGAMNEHGGVCNRLLWMQDRFHLDGTSSALQKTPCTFDVSVWEFFWPIMVGARLVIARPDGHKDPQYLLDLIRREKITVVHFVPSMLQLFLDEVSSVNCDSLQYVVCSGEAMPVSLQEAFFRKSTAELCNLYGPTEAAVDVTHWTCLRDTPTKSVPIGRPIANTQAYVLDAQRQPVPIGTDGELYIGGIQVGRGYLNQPALTAERFIPDPFSNRIGARLYRTGDLVRYRSDGNLEFLGRLDHQVKIRGFRIELGEIEAVLSKNPDLASGVVTAREDQPSAKYLVGYVVSRAHPGPTSAALREFLKTKLPDYMIPAVFVSLDALPLTPNGKIDRKALPAPTDLNQLKDESTFVPPRTETERQLTAIWEEVLGRHPISIHDNFFALGGHSLNAVRIVSRARTVLKKELTIRSVIEFFTVGKLSEFADRLSPVSQNTSLDVTPTTTPPAESGASPSSAPASINQTQLWFLNQLHPENCAYNLAHQLRFRGRLNLSALVASLGEIIQRHEILRARFESQNGTPGFVIGPAVKLDLPEIDLTQKPVELRSQELQRLAEEEISRPFDLASGPLFRCKLIRLAAQDQVLLLAFHHIVYDGWSTQILLKEILRYYQNHCQQAQSPLQDLAFQFTHFVDWQRQELTEEKTAKHISFWREELAQVPFTIGLPFRLTKTAQNHHQQKHTLKLSAEVTAALRQLAQLQGVTIFATLLASFQMLLFRYTGQKQFLLGVPFAGRTDGPAQDLIGYFVNSLPIKADFSSDPDFSDFLRQIQDRLWQVQAHQDFPFEKLVTEFCAKRDAEQNPLFQMLVAFEDLRQSTIALPDLSIEVTEVTPTTAMFDLTLLIKDHGRELACEFLFDSERYDNRDIHQLAEHFGALLKSIQSNPHQRVTALEIIPLAERQQLLTDWNQTAAEYPWDKCVHQLFEEQVTRTQGAVAVVCGEQSLTYQQLNQRANQLAHQLQSLGVGPEVLVAICVERSLDLVVGLLAILKAGGAYVPLDTNYPKARLDFILNDAQPLVVVTQTHLQAGLALSKCQTLCIDNAPGPNHGAATENPTCPTRPHNLAYVIYTSGSTGIPKGVAIEHRSPVAFIHWALSVFSPQECAGVLFSTSICFDLSVFEIFVPLASGGTVILAENTLALPELAAKESVTLVNTVPSAIRDLISRNALPRSVQVVNLAGEILSPELVNAIYQSPNVQKVYDLYGPSETTTYSTWALRQKNGPYTIGRPIANTRVYILDEQRQLLPIGIAGELYIGGDGLARGYLNQPALTAEKFVPDPFSNTPGARLYRTGDRCRYLPDGNIEFLGRLDHQVKLRGFRIELGEIESVLSTHPAVQGAVVILRENQPGDTYLAAYFVPRQSSSPTSTVLREFLKTKLPDYMIPAVFVSLDALPLTPNGKIDRKALPAPTDLNLLKDKTTFVPPRTETERQLTAIWEEVLGRHPISIHDNFFALGGHSLMATRVVARIAERCDIHLPLRRLFENPTVADLSSELDKARVTQSIETESMLKELEGLSDEETRRLLGE